MPPEAPDDADDRDESLADSEADATSDANSGTAGAAGDAGERSPSASDRPGASDRTGTAEGDEDAPSPGGDPPGGSEEAGEEDDRTEVSGETGEDGNRPPPARADRPSPAGDAADVPDGPMDVVREVLSSVGIVVVVGLLLFGASGVWPPLVAVESGSMEPHMFKGDLVFVAEAGRYAPDTAVAGVVTYQRGEETGYRSFGSFGNVVVFRPDGRSGTPVIHRARLYVEEGENWVQRANPAFLGDSQTCAEVVTCPAPHDGFITRGDNNPRYDQVGRSRSATLSTVVKPEWVRGNAKFRVPLLGCIRLELSGDGCEWPVVG